MGEGKLPFSQAQELDLAIRHLNQGEYESAISEFNKALLLDPGNGLAHAKLGHAYLRQKDFSLAAKHFNLALEINPRNTEAAFGLGFYHFEQGETESARGTFQQTLELDPANEHGHFGLGLCYLREGGFGRAIAEFKRTLESNPAHPQAHYHLGLCYCRTQDYSAAIAEFNQALGEDYRQCHGRGTSPYTVNILHELGNIYMTKKDYPQAIAQFKRALQLDFSDEQAHASLGFCYRELGQLPMAIGEFGLALEADPGSLRGHLGLGFCYFGQRRFTGAAEKFRKVLDLDPQNGYAYSGLGQVYFEHKQYDLALEAFNNAIKFNAEIESAHQGLGRIYLERRINSLTEREFLKALSINADSVYAHQMLGYVYKRQGKHDQAVEEFIKATDLYLAQERKDKEWADIREAGAANPLKENNKGQAIKIIRMPSFCSAGEIHSTELNTSLLPPLALGQIVAHLRGNGIAIDQDDLNIKIHYDNYYSQAVDERVDTAIFFQEDRICQYLLGKEDGDLHSAMQAVERKTDFSGYAVILFSLPVVFSNSSCLMFTLSLARFIKTRYNPVIILGGARQTLDLLVKYDCKDIDFIIDGEGEPALLKLLPALEMIRGQKREPDFQANKDGKTVVTEVRPPLKPDFNGLPIDKYRYRGTRSFCPDESPQILNEFSKSETLILPVRFIKGCPYECVFCASATNKSIYVLKPAQAARHLKELQEEYGATGYFFLDDTVNISRAYANGLCDEIIEAGTNILWSDCARADNLDRDTIFKMRRSGCIRLIFGMETASRSLLKYVDKKIGLRGLENALRWSDEAGIWTGLEVICGLPQEKDNDIEETLAFLNRNKEHINTLYFNQFDLRDGSLLLENAQEFGIGNVVELNQYANQEFTNFHKYGYDEIGGLRWQDKKRQIVSSYKRIVTSIDWDSYLPPYEFEHFLFFLYKKFSDKHKIRDVFSKAAEEKNNLHKKLLLSSHAAGVV